jgi:NTE family protein
VGRIDRPLAAPRYPWDVARVAFEVSRRHRYIREMAGIPSTVDVYVLPSGTGAERDDSPLAYRDMAATARRIARAFEASAAYLQEMSA